MEQQLGLQQARSQVPRVPLHGGSRKRAGLGVVPRASVELGQIRVDLRMHPPAGKALQQHPGIRQPTQRHHRGRQAAVGRPRLAQLHQGDLELSFRFGGLAEGQQRLPKKELAEGVVRPRRQAILGRLLGVRSSTEGQMGPGPSPHDVRVVRV